MDKNILKKFAVESRKLLEEKVADRINLYYVDEDFNEDKSGEVITLTNEKHNLTLTSEEYGYRESLLNRIKKYDGEYGDGLSHVIEEAAFTWFNRLACLRYMELHDFLPLTKEKESLNIRVLSSRENEAEPEIMKNSSLNNPELDIKINHEKLDKITNINDRFEYVLLKVCEKMGEVLPQIFDGETDYIELLIPKNLLNADSFLDKLIKEVPEDNFNDIEIIGWFYQYYNQSEKDKAMKEKRAYKKSEIPYVTQIFTPDWIVKYMVENSLGRLYIEKTGDESLESEFKYFIKDNIEIDNKGIMPENITFIDPCMGSGHILIYAFEVFMKLYLNAGYNKKDIPELILKNNLYGLDIDDRAGQFAIISVMLKAREYDKDIFNKIDFDKLNILSIKETDTEYLQWTQSIREADIRETIEYLIETFKNAKEIGSLLIVEDRDYKKVEDYLNNASDTVFNMLLRNNLKDVIRVAKILSKKYDVVVTNPPYMPTSKMSDNGKRYLELFYKDSKTDLCTAFMETRLVDNDKYLGMINMHSWMFLSSYEDLRKKILETKSITTMLHLGSRAFEEMGGEVIQTTTYVLKNQVQFDRNCIIINLKEFEGREKEEQYLNNANQFLYNINVNKFLKIPGYNLSYWLSENLINVFNNSKPFTSYAELFQGIITGDNNKFLRGWYEVNVKKIAIGYSNIDEINLALQYWIPYNKGGEFRKFYGNQEYIVYWKNGAKDKTRGKETYKKYYLKEYVSWSYITMTTLAARYFPQGFLWDVAGSGFFAKKGMRRYLHGLIASKIGTLVLNAINPTINYQVENVAIMPVIFDDKNKEKLLLINDIIDDSVLKSKDDWDSFEISWDFKKHPLV